MKKLSVCGITLAFLFGMFDSQVLAQSWSAWKQVAEENLKCGKTAEAERSWKSAYQLLVDSGARDKRFYISAYELAKLQWARGEKTSAIETLSRTSSGQDLNSDTSAEKLNCLKLYLTVLNETKNGDEITRVKKLIVELEKHIGNGGIAGHSDDMLFGDSAKEMISEQINAARQKEKAGDLTGATEILISAVKLAKAAGLRTKSNEVLVELIGLYYKQNRFHDAELAFRESLEIIRAEDGVRSPRYHNALLSHSKLLRLLGENQVADREEKVCREIRVGIKHLNSKWVAVDPSEVSISSQGSLLGQTSTLRSTVTTSQIGASDNNSSSSVSSFSPSSKPSSPNPVSRSNFADGNSSYNHNYAKFGDGKSSYNQNYAKFGDNKSWYKK